MRKQFQDPDEYLGQHMEAAAERYMDGLQRAELKPNNRLTRAMSERAFHEASVGYQQHLDETLHHNVQNIMRDHQRRDRQIRREGASWGLKIFPIITLVFALIAWYDFGHGDPGMWIIYAAGALVFFVLTLAAIANRWR